jgi:diadenosine tetraphosphate (Ap4A) HIT family hydrolase
MSETEFTLHPQLAADCLDIGDWPLCRLLRMNDRTYPWLILVPRRAGIREIIDLAGPDRARLMEEIAAASETLRRETGAHKLNVAALGNAVPQLHVHVIARFTTDPAWPRPIWGIQPPLPLGDEADRECVRWQAALLPGRIPGQ